MSMILLLTIVLLNAEINSVKDYCSVRLEEAKKENAIATQHHVPNLKQILNGIHIPLKLLAIGLNQN
jgi:hypothetical protein